MFKGLGTIASMMKQAQTMGPKMEAAMEELKQKTVTGEAGAGMIVVTANGIGQILSVTIDPALEEKNEWEMVRDLLPAAINQAITKSKQLHVEAMQSVTSDLPIPENMEGMLKSFMGHNGDNA